MKRGSVKFAIGDDNEADDTKAQPDKIDESTPEAN